MNRVVIITGGARGIGRSQLAHCLIPGEGRHSRRRRRSHEDALKQTSLPAETYLQCWLMSGLKAKSQEWCTEGGRQVNASGARGIDVRINNAAIVSHSHMWPDRVWALPGQLVHMSLEFWNKVSETT